MACEIMETVTHRLLPFLTVVMVLCHLMATLLVFSAPFRDIYSLYQEACEAALLQYLVV